MAMAAHSVKISNRSIQKRDATGSVTSLFLYLSRVNLELHHLLHRTAQLGILAAELLLGSVVDLDIGHQQLVLQVIASHVLHANLRNAEHQSGVDLRLPPNSGHRAWHGGTDQLTDLQLLINPREAMSVGIVVFANQHTRGLRPLIVKNFVNKVLLCIDYTIVFYIFI